MDSLTQACLGAAVAGAVMPRLGRRALLLGAALGTLPDLDVAIDYGDAVADYTRHRGFSHSLPVLAALATLLAWLASRWRRSREIASFAHWWWLFALCLLTHPLLDAFTTYGTQLLWPLPLTPVSWHSLFIIDPAYTLPLLIGVLVFAIRPRRRPLGIALGVSCAYIGFSLGAQAFVESRVKSALAARGLAQAPMLVQPAPLTTLLWRVTVIDQDQALEGWVGLLDGDAPVTLTPWPLGDTWRQAALATTDGQRLAWFSGPFLRYAVVTPEDAPPRLTATDLRLGIPGLHPFVFTLAARDADGGWQPVPSVRESQGRPDRALLERLLARVVDPSVEPVLPPRDVADGPG
ncbi:metal-dependent hydrolase [Salinicola sp. JS01]|uniref:metal-dependent hydrolase n=1 Tax=Salinicola sp. JS01 TaxID=3050071 RepID=UPI00255BE4B3|nr:metal-dependent hydrolase [Salinicola sp. JS01]WIX31692.1 metal-dependent hydrolase [Salinicola sp. JS01]